MSLRTWWRSFANLDGPWCCLTCRTMTVVKDADALRCIGCERAACGCDEFWTNPRCEHGHAPSPEAVALEKRAEQIARGAA